MISIIKVIEKPNTPAAIKRENPIKSVNKIRLFIPGVACCWVFSYL